MKNKIRRILGILLVLVLCLSFIPAAAFAAPVASDTDAPEQAEEIPNDEIPNDPPFGTADEIISKPDDVISESDVTGTDAPLASPTTKAAVLTPIEPELLKVVSEPLVKVVFHYYDDSQNQNITDIADYAVASSHSYYAIAMANGEDITIAANKFPSLVPTSTDALRFRVLLNGSEDITSVAAYEPAAGLVFLPQNYMGHEITVEWYCPTAEITMLPVKATVCIGQNGEFTTTVTEQNIASNASSITVPLAISNGLVVSQNGIDLPDSAFSVENGNLIISASALGGDLSVSAYALSIMPLGTGFSQVVHTRSADQVYYGYYTSYYTANGNTAFCLDPNASGLSAGTYSVSRFLQRGADDTLIKCAYYLYGGPGWNSVKNILFQSPDTMTAYGLCHAAASYVYLNDDSAFKGISSTTKGQLLNLISYVSSLSMPPDGFDAFIYNESSSTTQSLMGWDYSEPTEPPLPPTPPADGHLEIIKVSNNPAMSNGNSCYSLAGAVFNVYNSSHQLIGSIITDANGRGRLQNIPPESGYYLVEVMPPKGYALNSSVIGFYILSDQTTTVTVNDQPQNDPPAILLSKLDNDTSTATPQGNASLVGAEFTVKYYNGLYTASQLSGLTPTRTWVLRTGANGTAYLNASYLVSGDAFYYAGNGDPTLPLGTVSIQETKAPVGYLLNSEVFVRQITSAGTVESVRTYNAPIVKDAVIRGGVSIEKWDYDLNRKASPQGDATLAGAVFEIYNRSANSVVVGGKTYAPGTVVHAMTTDATGTATAVSDLLPYGQYEIIEKTPPTGYLGTGVVKQTFNITSNGVIVSLKTSATAIKNNVIRGGISIEKWDIERDERTLKQGDATLESAIFEIWNRSANSVFVNGTEYAPNAVVHTLTTDADGWAGTAGNLLPYGTYEIIEKTPPVGYLNTGIIRQTVEIRENGVIIEMTASDDVIKNNIIRGGVRIEKWDNEIDEHRPQGGATFEGAVFEIINRSADSVLVLDVLCDPGDVVYVFSTDETGSALTPSDLLPYGTYQVREVEPPEGYLATGVLSQSFTIREHGKIVELDTTDTAIKNDPIRGDLKGVKISDGDAKRLANVPFRITSLTTGESHVIITDRNGEFNTASRWNPHSQHTNRGETDSDGIWFGELRTLNDDKGALLYDTYILDEQRCEANLNYELLSFTVSVYRHNTVVDLGTLTNDHIAIPEIFTTARDKNTDSGIAYASATATIIDTIYYSGLKAGQEYTLKGVLMDKETGAPLIVNGLEVTAEKTFRAVSDAGTVAMEFTFDASALKGKAVVVFESLEHAGKEIASHADIDDEGQTITFTEPVIGTSAAGPNGEKELNIGSKVTLIDTVSYENLIVGKPYTLKGMLMDKATGAPLLIEGAKVIAETTFKPDAPSGTIEVVFTFDVASLMGKTVVVFESLEYEGTEIASHADIDDKGQTVTFKAPKIGTSAKAADGSKTVPIAENVTVVDTVTCENLVPQQKYVLKGVLMDKETGLPLMKDGKSVTAETTFTPASASGSVEVRFAFDTRAIAGRTLVVFETLEFDGKEIAAHADINDTAQAVSVVVPKDEPKTPTPATPTTVPGKPVPQTSDDYSIILWLALAAIALLGVIVSTILLCKKKRNALILLILCIVLIIGGAFMALSELQQYSVDADAYAGLERFVTHPEAPANSEAEAGEQHDRPSDTMNEEAGSPASSLPSVDFNALRAINPDIVGWLICEDTPINYPVARGADNTRYLRYLYDGKKGKAGTPFLDFENSPDFTDKNSIVYGHNLLNGSMFSCLLEYQDQSYYDEHPTMLLLTTEGAYRMEVFAAFKANPNEAGTDASPWRQKWDTDSNFAAWLAQMKGHSLIQTGVEPTEDEHILTLSTCISRGRDRFLVMGRLTPVE